MHSEVVALDGVGMTTANWFVDTENECRLFSDRDGVTISESSPDRLMVTRCTPQDVVVHPDIEDVGKKSIIVVLDVGARIHVKTNEADRYGKRVEVGVPETEKKNRKENLWSGARAKKRAGMELVQDERREVVEPCPDHVPVDLGLGEPWRSQDGVVLGVLFQTLDVRSQTVATVVEEGACLHGAT